jgi:ethanolamine ammonia-lyase small subunit
VQIVVSEGLSARAVTVNLPELLPALRITLAEAGLRVGPPFCVRLGRVGLLNAVNAVADARVVVLLVGERPGLGRADALSAYLGFRPQVDSTDADREVICNIFPGGLPAREAARRIAGQIIEILRAGASGVRRGARS